MEYAGFWRRFLANIIDTLILSVFGFLLGISFGFLTVFLNDSTAGVVIRSVVNLISYAVTIFYYIYFIGAKGQTLGKMAMGIKVVKLPDNSNPGYLSAFLREIIGKILSAFVILLGFFWMLWDPKKQTWHDKIANTVVIKV